MRSIEAERSTNVRPSPDAPLEGATMIGAGASLGVVGDACVIGSLKPVNLRLFLFFQTIRRSNVIQYFKGLLCVAMLHKISRITQQRCA